MSVSAVLPVNDSRLPMEIVSDKRGKNLESLKEIIRGEGKSQPQSIASEIILPRDRAAKNSRKDMPNCKATCRSRDKKLGDNKLYLVGTTDRWNDAKKSEEHDRVKHNIFN